MRNRIIAIVLVVALIPCCLAVNASAAGEKDTIVNLMQSLNDYTFVSLSGGTVDNYAYQGYAFDVDSVKITWGLDRGISVDCFYFTLECEAAISPSIIIDFVFFSKEAELVGRVGNFHNYKCYIDSDSLIAEVNLNLKFSNTYHGILSVVSAFGTRRSNAYSLDKVSLQNQALLYEADDDLLYRYIFENKNNASLPVYTKHTTNYIMELVDPLIEGIIYSHINTDRIPFDYADSITFMFNCCGSVKDVGFSLLSKSGKYVGQLEVDLVEWSYVKSTDVYFPDTSSHMQWPMYTYSATVDLTGYDLSELNLSFFCNLEPVWLLEYEGITGYTFGLTNVILYQTIEDEPWYARFGNWIKGGFNSVVSGLTSGFNSVVNAISSVFNPDGSNELSQAGEDLSQSAGDIDSAGDVLGSVDQPDVNSGYLIGGFTNFDSGGLKVLSCLTSNDQVTQMMVVVFTFSLAGYIFFGKKG